MPSITPEIDAFQQAQAFGQRQASGQLAQVGVLQGILARQQAAQREQQLRGVLSRAAQESGGDKAKFGQLLMNSGEPELVKVGAGLIPKAATPQLVNTVAADGTTPVQKFVTPNSGDIYPTQPKEQKAPFVRRRPEQVGNQYFEITEQMGADGTFSELGRRPLKDPTIVMPKNPPSPIATDQGFFERGPSGLTPLMNPNNPNQQLRPPSLVSGGNQQALALRREFNANPEVKLANSLEPRVGPTAQYIAEVGTGIGNPVSDAELVKLWLMTTHPKGDQIGVLDMRQIEKMPDLWGRVKNVAGNFVLGKTLDSETRSDMWRSISEKFKSTAKVREQRKADIVGRGKRMNIDPSLIFSPEQE